MTYFSNFPLVVYDNALQVNITRRAGIANVFKNDPAYFVEYNVKESDTPEIIADKIYDDPSLAWVVLDMNNIVNLFEEWPLTQSALESYVNEKYPNPFAIHHYISASNNMIVDSTLNPTWDNVPVTNYEYEIEENEKKRNIKLLMPEYVGTVISRHQELMRL